MLAWMQKKLRKWLGVADLHVQCGELADYHAARLATIEHVLQMGPEDAPPMSIRLDKYWGYIDDFDTRIADIELRAKRKPAPKKRPTRRKAKQ